MSVRVRFAPSPTGHVHLGNIRTAIFNWLFARHESGQFLLRIEDTDRERSTPAAVKTVFDVLDWLGLDRDEDPMYQSARSEEHLAIADELLSRGLAYKEDKGETGRGECVIFKMPGEDMCFHDEIKGDLCKKADDLQDFVIVRSNGTPVFHLANVSDDIEMGITHVIRGDDHIENTYRHVALYKAIGAPVPKFAHLPMIVNQNGKPYSKRDGDCFVSEFREKGFSAAALTNYLALLGWSPGDDREKMTRDEMIESFALDRVKSSAAQMDVRKLTHLNGQYVSEMSISDFVAAIKQALSECEWFVAIDDADLVKVCELMQSRTHLYSYALDWKYFFSDEFDFDEKGVRKCLKKEGVGEALATLRGSLADISFTCAEIEKVIRSVEADRGIREGKLNQPIRVLITGRTAGAGICETMEVLGEERVIRRLGRAEETCGA